MNGQIAARVLYALTGALGGGLLWAVTEAGDRDWIGPHAGFALVALVLAFFPTFLGMAGSLGLARSAPRALGLSLAAGGLIWLASLRHSDVWYILFNPLQTIAAMTVVGLPVPFLIAQAQGNWRNYPELFLQAWGIVLRFVAAIAFAGLVWMVIFLSDGVLRIVGIEQLGRLVEQDSVALILSGAMLGLGLAVVQDLAELLSPYVVLRIFRLFLPLVLAVMAIFLVALPFRGLDGLAGTFSPAMLLLTMVAGGTALVSIAVDRSDAEATDSRLLTWSARGIAVVLPIFAALVLWAVWLRITDYGVTPERLFVGLLGGLGLGYGLIYALAVLRGAGWMERIRRGNIWMALVAIVVAALWLSPLLNAERISARDQIARFEAGLTPVQDLDLYALDRWGTAGAEARARLDALAKEPGQEALAQFLTTGAVSGPPQDELIARLAAVLPVQPAGATATRDIYLQAAETYLLEDWLRICETPGQDDSPSCLMVVADMMPLVVGEEAVLFLRHNADYTEALGLLLDSTGAMEYRQIRHPDGRTVQGAAAAELMRQYRLAPPPLTAAELNQLGTGGSGLVMQP